MVNKVIEERKRSELILVVIRAHAMMSNIYQKFRSLREKKVRVWTKRHAAYRIQRLYKSYIQRKGSSMRQRAMRTSILYASISCNNAVKRAELFLVPKTGRDIEA